jgi:hypothetical protein
LFRRLAFYGHGHARRRRRGGSGSGPALGRPRWRVQRVWMTGDDMSPPVEVFTVCQTFKRMARREHSNLMRGGRGSALNPDCLQSICRVLAPLMTKGCENSGLGPRFGKAVTCHKRAESPSRVMMMMTDSVESVYCCLRHTRSSGGGRGKCQRCCCCCWTSVTRLDVNGNSVYSLVSLGGRNVRMVESRSESKTRFFTKLVF